MGARRVSVSTLVEVVGNVPGIPVFEAEAVDVSSRGMHLRTAYLPHEGDPLVCRFENAGREILVEGVVAWRREHGRGGEFGVQFTALDSKSVESLRELCGDLAVAPQNPEAGPIGALPPRSRFRWLVSPRSTVIQPSAVHTGRTADPAACLEKLMDKLVRRPSGAGAE